MADNVAFTASVATYGVATDKVTYSGDANQDVQLVRQVEVTGAEGAKTIGALNHHRVNTGTDNVNISANPSELIRFKGFNVHTSVVYAKFHNTAGTPTIGSGIVLTVAMPPGVPVNEAIGLPFSTGLGLTLTTDLADGSTNVPPTGTVITDTKYVRSA